jgi:hypothetical protein
MWAHHDHDHVMTLAFYGSRFIQKKIMRNDETVYIYIYIYKMLTRSLECKINLIKKNYLA